MWRSLGLFQYPIYVAGLSSQRLHLFRRSGSFRHHVALRARWLATALCDGQHLLGQLLCQPVFSESGDRPISVLRADLPVLHWTVGVTLDGFKELRHLDVRCGDSLGVHQFRSAVRQARVSTAAQYR